MECGIHVHHDDASCESHWDSQVAWWWSPENAKPVGLRNDVAMDEDLEAPFCVRPWVGHHRIDNQLLQPKEPVLVAELEVGLLPHTVEETHLKDPTSIRAVEVAHRVFKEGLDGGSIPRGTQSCAYQSLHAAHEFHLAVADVCETSAHRPTSIDQNMIIGVGMVRENRVAVAEVECRRFVPWREERRHRGSDGAHWTVGSPRSEISESDRWFHVCM